MIVWAMPVEATWTVGWNSQLGTAGLAFHDFSGSPGVEPSSTASLWPGAQPCEMK